MNQTSFIADPVTARKPRTEMTPRDYQQRGIERAFELFEKGSPGVIFRQPTGSGKTVSGTLIADLWCQQGDDYKVMVLAHERQLVNQFAQEIEDILGERPPIEMAGARVAAYPMPSIVVASRQTLREIETEDMDGNPTSKSRLFKFDNKLNWLVILDECHRWKRGLSTCRHILEWFEQNPKSRRLGLTATPERGDKVSLKNILPDVASDYRLYDVDGGPCAVTDGWAVPYDQRFITVEGVDFKNLKEVAGDFTDEELESVLNERETMLKLVKPLMALAGERRTIIFNPTVAVAKLTASTINGELSDWNAAVSLDGSVPELQRQDVYSRHQRGEFQYLSVCGLCREGYNDPGIQAVAVFRPTKSRSLAEQMKGRGCRPLRGLVDKFATPEERRAAIAASDKPDCMIIDLVGITGMADCASTAHILASGKPDEVIERANNNALKKKDQPVDMAEEVRKAERELKEEREAARLARLERERKEREEAEKRAKLKGEVQWKDQKVEAGHGARGVKQKSGARMLYGKHKGKLVSEVSTGYLAAFVPHVSVPWFKSAIQRELDSRNPKSAPAKAVQLEDINRAFMEACDAD